VGALRELVSGLPAGLPAAVFVVLHVPADFPSRLPQLLSDAGPLRAEHARNGASIDAGRIYVAPPDFHMIVRRSRVELCREPREHHARPAIDPLFRSAARAYGKRVAGVVMSGTLGDGTVGLMAIKSHGGTTVVQRPDEAVEPSMPHKALQYARVDYVLPVREIAALLSRLAHEARNMHEEPRMEEEESLTPQMHRDFEAQTHGARAGETTVYSCPDCGGVLWEDNDSNVLNFRCHQGHRYAPESLLIDQSENIENALWSAARALMERATLHRQLATRMRDGGQPARAEALDEQAQRDEAHLHLLRERVLEGLGRPATEPGAPADTGRAEKRS
jgi:two-component system chemotaxis response regulator CheB